MSFTTIAIIPAKAYSRRIKNKNLRIYQGKPLFQHTLDAAMECNLLTHVILSTDSKEIISIAEDLYPDNSKLIIMQREPWYCLDGVEVDEVARHTMRVYQNLFNNNKLPDAVVTLQPTSPNRKSWHITQAVKWHRYDSHKATVIGVNITDEDRLGGYLWRKVAAK